MKKAFTALALVAMSIFLVGWSFGDKKPKKNELESAFKMELPSYVQLSDFDVEILENMGNKVDPRWGSRFKAIIKTKIPLYEQDQKDRKNKITFVVLKNEKNTKTEVYGKIISTMYQGKWKHNFDIEGRPIRNLGHQLNEFNGRVLVRGSNEEREYFAKIEQQKAELRKNIANAKSILVGAWRDNNSICTYNADGTYRTDFDNNNVGTGRWSVVNGSIISQEKQVRVNGKWKPSGFTMKTKIVYIDQNNLTTKDKQTWHAKRIR